MSRTVMKNEQQKTKETKETKEVNKTETETETETRQLELIKALKRKEQKTERKRKKENDGQDHLQTIIERAHRTRYVVGIDMSKRSPAMCLFDRVENRCHTVAFTEKVTFQKPAFQQQIQKPRSIKTIHQQSFQYSIDLFGLPKKTLQSNITTKYTETIHQYHYTTEKLLAALASFPVEDVYVIIEGYSFQKQRGQFGSSSVTDLAEATGILKCKLFAAKIPFDIVPPTTIKLWFCGHGNAKKPQMFSQFHNIQVGVNLDLLFPGRNPESIEIPSPQQDIVDAFAIAYSLFIPDHRSQESHKKIVKQNAKRKRREENSKSNNKKQKR